MMSPKWTSPSWARWFSKHEAARFWTARDWRDAMRLIRHGRVRR